MQQSAKISLIYFILLMVMLVIPFAQMTLKVFSEKPLNGSIEYTKSPSLTYHFWFDETFQSTAEKYLNEHFGFRNFLVRLYNEINFLLYKKTTAKDVIVGKDNYLFEKNYIRAYYGRDFVGDSLLSERVHRMKVIQDSLEQNNITFLVVFAPGKAQFFPEKIPDWLRGEKSKTNYHTLLREADQQGLNYIDFNAVFLNLKNSSPYPLYPKTGIHWSHYGMDLFIDSMMHYIEANRHQDLIDITFTDRHLSTNYQSPDTDIENGMNLLFPINNYPMPYSTIHFEDAQKPKPKLLVVSDSYFWQIYNTGLMWKAFSEGEFWYYNHEVFKHSNNDPSQVPVVNLRDKILGKEVIMLLATDANLHEFPWEFDEQLYQFISDNEGILAAHIEKKIEGYMHAIRSDKNWLEDVARKAAQKNISVDSMVRLDAIYMYKMEKSREE